MILLEDRKQILRNYNSDCFYFLENENTTLQKSPGDDVLKVLSTKLGDCAIQLGVELGLSVADITETLKKSENCTFKETLDVMTKWKKSSQDKTILMLMKAVQLADGDGIEFLREKYG